MKITAPYRGRSASKRLDMTDMKRALGVDGFKLWCAVAIVQAPQGEPHFEILADDVHVEVVTQPSLVELTCRLAAGMWRIPNIGEEVLVMIPEGEIAFMPILMDVLSSGSVPAIQGPALGTTVIARPHVLIHDGGGGANPLPTLAEHNALVAAHNALVVKVNALIAAHNALTLPVSGASAGPTPPAQQVAPPATTTGDASGTTVLEAQ